jgi:hypothetical protein
MSLPRYRHRLDELFRPRLLQKLMGGECILIRVEEAEDLVEQKQLLGRTVKPVVGVEGNGDPHLLAEPVRVLMPQVVELLTANTITYRISGVPIGVSDQVLDVELARTATNHTP